MATHGEAKDAVDAGADIHEESSDAGDEGLAMTDEDECTAPSVYHCGKKKQVLATSAH